MPKGRQRASGRARAVPGAQQGQAEGEDRTGLWLPPVEGEPGLGPFGSLLEKGWGTITDVLEVLGSAGSSSPASWLVQPHYKGTRPEIPGWHRPAPEPQRPCLCAHKVYLSRLRSLCWLPDCKGSGDALGPELNEKRAPQNLATARVLCQRAASPCSARQFEGKWLGSCCLCASAE